MLIKLLTLTKHTKQVFQSLGFPSSQVSSLAFSLHGKFIIIAKNNVLCFYFNVKLHIKSLSIHLYK